MSITTLPGTFYVFLKFNSCHVVSQLLVVPEEKKNTIELLVFVILSWCSIRGKIQRDYVRKLAVAALVR